MLIPSDNRVSSDATPSLSRRVNANSQHGHVSLNFTTKLIKKGEC